MSATSEENLTPQQKAARTKARNKAAREAEAKQTTTKKAPAKKATTSKTTAAKKTTTAKKAPVKKAATNASTATKPAATAAKKPASTRKATPAKKPQARKTTPKQSGSTTTTSSRSQPSKKLSLETQIKQLQAQVAGLEDQILVQETANRRTAKFEEAYRLSILFDMKAAAESNYNKRSALQNHQSFTIVDVVKESSYILSMDHNGIWALGVNCKDETGKNRFQEVIRPRSNYFMTNQVNWQELDIFVKNNIPKPGLYIIDVASANTQ